MFPTNVSHSKILYIRIFDNQIVFDDYTYREFSKGVLLNIITGLLARKMIMFNSERRKMVLEKRLIVIEPISISKEFENRHN
jgi:hypothetical protein